MDNNTLLEDRSSKEGWWHSGNSLASRLASWLVWPWSRANIMTTTTVKLIKVFPLPEPDIITDNCPVISHLPWHILPYVCKSMQTLKGREGTMCGWEVGLTPASGRDETSGNDYERGCIYHCVFHKSCCEMSGSGRKVRPSDLCVCMLLCQGQSI